MLEQLSRKNSKVRSFTVTPENPTGEKGKAAMATLEEGISGPHAKDLGVGWKVNPCVRIYGGTKVTLVDFKGEGVIKHIWMTDTSQRSRQLLIRIYFDGHDNPAVEAPLSDFFASANYHDYRQLSSLAMCVNPRRGLNCYFEMPYRTGFRIEVENTDEERCTVYYEIACEEKPVPEDAVYFHAQFRRTNPTVKKEPFTVLDNVTGSGHFVGMYLYWGPKSRGWWGEGEVKFYLDGDCEFPSVCSTGLEDYFCGSHDFEEDTYREFNTPYAGMYKVDQIDDTYSCQQYFNMYRWHITDPIRFGHDIKVTVQALGKRSNHMHRTLTDDVSSVVYWYSDNLDDIYPPLPCHEDLQI